MDKLKQIVIYYFSGTGNARQIALWFKEFAEKKDIACKLVNIEDYKLEKDQLEDSETLIMMISPIHGFNYPKIMINFIQHFSKGHNKLVLMNTRAGMKIGSWVTPGLTGIAFLLSSFILKRKGYEIVGQIPFDMPSNWISIHPALNNKTVKYLHKTNYYRVEKHANKIYSGRSDFLAYRDLLQDILIAPISLAYYLVGRFVFAKSFYASSNCNNCGICLKGCPVNAIKTVNERPFWTLKCESCMKCMNTCPEQAIETAHGLLVFTSIFSSVLFSFILDKLLLLSIQSCFFRLVLVTIVFFLLLIFFYRIQHLLLKNTTIAKLISLFSLTHLKFWGRYKSISDKEWKL